MSILALQRFYPDPDGFLEQSNTLQIGSRVSKKRIGWNTQGRIEEILRTRDGVFIDSYGKDDAYGDVHTKLLMDTQRKPSSEETFRSIEAPQVDYMELPLYQWQDPSIAWACQFIAKIYTGENLGIVILAIQIFFEWVNPKRRFLESDFRELLTPREWAPLVWLVQESKPIPDSSRYHDNKLARVPASKWKTNRPTNFVMSEVDSLLKRLERDS